MDVSNKTRAVNFLRMAGSGNVRQGDATFVADSFIHHNAYFKGDRESLLDAMEQAHRASPNKSVEVKRIVEDGDIVVTHSLVTRAAADAAPIAVIHIFRFADMLIAELWDIGQVLPKESPNENGPF